MSILPAIRRKTMHGFRTVFTSLLLVLYIASTFQIEVLHKFFHSHDHLVSHAEAQEEDPCHRAIYHHDLEKGCGHHSHILVTNKCDLCDLIFHTDQILLSNFESPSIDFFAIDFVFNSPDITCSGQSIDSSRAPPVV